MALQSYRYTFVSRAEHKRATRGTRMCCTRNTDVLRHLFAGIHNLFLYYKQKKEYKITIFNIKLLTLFRFPHVGIC